MMYLTQGITMYELYDHCMAIVTTGPDISSHIMPSHRQIPSQQSVVGYLFTLCEYMSM